MKIHLSKNYLSLFVSLFLLAIITFNPCFGQSTTRNISTNSVSTTTASETIDISLITKEDIDRYIKDSASRIEDNYQKQIAAYCTEIEKQASIRVFVKTENVKDINDGELKGDAFFSEWIRSIGLDKKGILIYAMLPEGTAQGKILFKAGIGLKYIITKEIGEKILNEVIVPNNALNKDGKGFLEGIQTLKKILVDDLARSQEAFANEPKAFSLISFLWSYKIFYLAFIAVFIFIYIVFFVERCPKCDAKLKVTKEVLKEPGDKTLGMQRKIYVCENCGFTRRKKEPIYPSGMTGIIMRITGTRRNVPFD